MAFTSFLGSIMFWTDANSNVIYQSNLDGRDLLEVYRYAPSKAQLTSNTSEHVPHYYSIAADANCLYFTDFYNK